MSSPIPPALKHDGMYRVAFCDTIADISAPTVAELNAGLQLSCQITPGGLAREANDERIDDSRLCSTYSTERMGRTSFPGFALTMVHIDTVAFGSPDDAFDTLVKGNLGYVVERSDKSYSEAWAAGDKVKVYPVECGSFNDATPTANENQTFTIPMAVTSDPDRRAVVAA